MLKKVKERGIEVILILGDMGSKKVEFISDDGIHFLGTGLNRSKYRDPKELETMPKDWIITDLTSVAIPFFLIRGVCILFSLNP